MAYSQLQKYCFIGIVALLLIWVALVIVNRQISQDLPQPPMPTSAPEDLTSLQRRPFALSPLDVVEPVGSEPSEQAQIRQEQNQQKAPSEEKPVYEPPLQDVILIQ